MFEQEKPFTEKDWKLFRARIPGWQEAYMAKLNAQYIELLSGEGTPSDKFWELEKRVRQDKNRPGVLIEMRRSIFVTNLANLMRDGVIGFEDLDGFSETLIDRMKLIASIDSMQWDRD